MYHVTPRLSSAGTVVGVTPLQQYLSIGVSLSTSTQYSVLCEPS